MSEQLAAARAKIEADLWTHFVAATEANGRGLFLRVADDGHRVRCAFAAVARFVLPLVVEMASLRSRVDELERRVSEGP